MIDYLVSFYPLDGIIDSEIVYLTKSLVRRGNLYIITEDGKLLEHDKNTLINRHLISYTGVLTIYTQDKSKQYSIPVKNGLLV
jgi:hypothetical protein